MKKRLLLAGAVLIGSVVGVHVRAAENQQQCENCRFLAGWFYANTNMSANEVVAWLQLCYDVWDCWGEAT